MQSKVDNDSLRILVVDDSDIGRTLLKKVLTKFSYSVDSAENGLVALEMVKRDIFDVVLTDINMPELDGIGIVNNIKHSSMSVGDTMPVLIAMSGNVGQSDQQEYFDNGFDYFVPKPIDFKVLKSILDLITNNSNRT